jgi:hypothetical protein
MRGGLPSRKGVVTPHRKDTFGGRLRRALDQSTIPSQSSLAIRLGVREATISAWIADDALPEGKLMVQLPTLLGVSGHWLLTGERPMTVAAGTELLQLEVVGVVCDGRLDDATLRRILADAEKLTPLPAAGLESAIERRASGARETVRETGGPPDAPPAPSSAPQAPPHTGPRSTREGGRGQGE